MHVHIERVSLCLVGCLSVLVFALLALLWAWERRGGSRLATNRRYLPCLSTRLRKTSEHPDSRRNFNKPNRMFIAALN